MPAARHQRANLLPLEGQVRGNGIWGGEETEATGGGKPQAEARGGGVERCDFKKLVEPAGLRAVVSYVEMEYQISERHACRLLCLARSRNRYRGRKAARDADLRSRLKELAAKRMHSVIGG